jgi:hypothetical protein
MRTVIICARESRESHVVMLDSGLRVHASSRSHPPLGGLRVVSRSQDALLTYSYMTRRHI